MKIGKPQDQTKPRLQRIAEIGAGIRIEKPLQSLLTAFQPDLHGLIGSFSFKDPSRFVFRVGSPGNLLQLVSGQARARAGGDAWFVGKSFGQLPPVDKYAAR